MQKIQQYYFFNVDIYLNRTISCITTVLHTLKQDTLVQIFTKQDKGRDEFIIQ